MRRRRILAAGLVMGGLCLGAMILVSGALVARIPLPDRLLAPTAIEVRYADDSVAHVRLAPDGRVRIPVRLSEVDPSYVQALVAVEDQRFWSHPGVDPLAIARAVVQDVRAGTIVSGASTITMQLARLLEPKPRTLASKVEEALRALQLRHRLGRTAVLEAYLAFAPYGGNIEGIEAASLLYFGHRADRLSAGEVAILLAVPQNPTARVPSVAHEKALRAARDAVLDRLLAAPDHGGFTTEALEAARSEAVPTSLRPVPRDAPHAASWLTADATSAAPILTTLDHGIQASVERAVRSAAKEWRAHGIHNAAVVVADHQLGEIKALVGNTDFFDAAHGGQIVGFDVARSPGSTLKPFVYGLALDRGQALPEMLTLDVPVSYEGYAPENFDGKYDGLVRLEDALVRSLNVPFVLQLEEMGMAPFLTLLSRGGVRSADLSPGSLGLSAIVGGIEITPLELAGLYAALAEDGRARDLQVVRSPEPPTRVLLTPGAAWLTKRALSIRDRPDFPTRKQLSATPDGIHWKTGTSFGFKDAWSVGSTDRYTVVVWVGNFDRTPSVHLVGAEAAAPLLFDLLEALSARGDGPSRAPSDLTEVEVCSLSGYPRGPACDHTRTALAPVASVPTERCPFHVPIEVDVETGERLGPSCRAGHVSRTTTMVQWPPRVRRWLQGLDTGALPTWAPGCDPGAGAGPTIRSPEPGAVAVLVPGMAADAQEIGLEADSAGELAWFVDGRLLGRAPSTEPLWWPPTPGVHDIAVQDRAGRSSHVQLEVRVH